MRHVVEIFCQKNIGRRARRAADRVGPNLTIPLRYTSTHSHRRSFVIAARTHNGRAHSRVAIETQRHKISELVKARPSLINHLPVELLTRILTFVLKRNDEDHSVSIFS